MNKKRIAMRAAASYGVLSAVCGVFVATKEIKARNARAKEKAVQNKARLERAYAHVYALDTIVTKLLNGKYDPANGTAAMDTDFEFARITYYLK